MFKHRNSPRKQVYLEFINVKSGGVSITKPGLSLGISSGLEIFYHQLQKDHRYSATFRHKNYQWKANNRTRLPGWNFLNFRHLGFRGIYPWMTEYEPWPYKIKRRPDRPHANGVIGFVGLSLDLNPRAQKFFSYLIGKNIKNATKLGCKTEIRIAGTDRTKFNAVILKCTSVRKLLDKYPFTPVTWNGQRAGYVKNPSGMWDIIVT